MGLVKLMNRVKKTGLFLTGGLGNQLFQFAAALSFSQKGNIEIFEKPGKPRLNSKGEPELFSLTVDEIAPIIRRSEDNFILRKSSGYILRSRIWPNKIEKLLIIRLVSEFAAAVIQTLNFRNLFFPVSISELGYKEIRMNKILKKIFNPFLIGYFQSWVCPDSVKKDLESLRLVEEGVQLRELRQEAKLQRPVIIHVRRGDYKAESTFGLPGETYYREAIAIVDQFYSANSIWVFSDEESEARKVLSWLPSERVKYIADVDGESGASLMAMRLGCAYVIANSTFSWWGAFLSQSKEPLVVAPTPWFIGQEEPSQLIPSNWIRVEY
jgi:hypothetical protein